MRRLKGARYYLIFMLLCFIAVSGYYFHEVDRKNSKVRIIQTKIELLNDSLSIGKFDYYSIQQITFKLKNTGEFPFIIQSVKTSCGCTAAKYDKKPVPQGETTTVILEYKPNSLGYFSKTADVVCNVPEGYVRLKISGEVVEK